MDIGYYELYNSKFDAKRNEKRLAIVIEFDDGKTIVKWDGETSSIVIHESLENFMKISGQGARCLVNHGRHGNNIAILTDRGEIQYHDGTFP
jgi:hypothetical protein